MRFRSRSIPVDAFRFDGTLEGAQTAREWLSSLDVEDAELSFQGEAAPIALDLTHQGGIETLEEGDWLIHCNGAVLSMGDVLFNKSYEVIDE